MYERRLAGLSVGRAMAGLAAASLVPALIAAAGPASASVRAHQDTAAGTISTVAGGIGGPATGSTVSLSDPAGVTYAGGAVYIASGTTVRKLNPASGYMTNVAGDGKTSPMGGNGASASKAGLETNVTLLDRSGNVVIGDSEHVRIRVAAQRTGVFYGQPMTAGHIYTIAGDGSRKLTGDGGPARDAGLGDIAGLAIDASGNLLVSAGTEIRVVAEQTGTFYGQSMISGDIYRIAGGGLIGGRGDGDPATSIKLFYTENVTLDASGNVLFTTAVRTSLVRVVAEQTGVFYGQSMTAGDIDPYDKSATKAP